MQEGEKSTERRRRTHAGVGKSPGQDRDFDLDDSFNNPEGVQPDVKMAVENLKETQ